MTPRRPGRAAGSPSQDITDPVTGGSRLLSRRCATCILGPGDKMHLGTGRLRAIIDSALAAGSFVVCHDTLTYGDFPDYGPAICRGFFDAYAGRSPALIFLRAWQRLTEVPPPGPAASGSRGAWPPRRAGPARYPLPDGSEPGRAATTPEAPSSRFLAIRELMEKHYGPAVPVTGAMICAVLDELDHNRQQGPGTRAPGQPAAPAAGDRSQLPDEATAPISQGPAGSGRVRSAEHLRRTAHMARDAQHASPPEIVT